MTVTSIGVHNIPFDGDIEVRRSFAKSQMENYIRALQFGKLWSPRQSVVRSYNVYDKMQFSIEQNLTIYVTMVDKEKKRWLVIVWLDAGDDLYHSPAGPWSSELSGSTLHTYFRPVSLYRPNVVFKKHQLAESSSSTPLDQLRADNSLAQSISLLSKYYGRSLNSTAMHDDPLYALNEVFAFVNASEVQCLNTIARNLSESAANSISIDPKASAELQSNLLHNREVLKRHIYRTSEVLTFLKNRHLLDWPKSPGGSKANLAVARLQQDFEYLLERGQSLQRHCEQELSMMMSNSNIAEARRGVEQGSRVFKLTVLASFYIPLSFSCALFSMTFVQFEDWFSGFYVWISVTIPILIISTLVITWSEEKAKAVWHRFCDNLKSILP